MNIIEKSSTVSPQDHVDFHQNSNATALDSQSVATFGMVPENVINAVHVVPSKRILYVRGEVAVQDPKETAQKLQHIASSIDGSCSVLFDCVKDGFEAVERVSKTNYDALIIFDDLVNMGGLDTIRIIQSFQNNSSMKVVLIGETQSQKLTTSDYNFISKLYSSSSFLGSHFMEVLTFLLV